MAMIRIYLKFIIMQIAYKYTYGCECPTETVAIPANISRNRFPS